MPEHTPIPKKSRMYLVLGGLGLSVALSVLFEDVYLSPLYIAVVYVAADWIKSRRLRPGA